jgi:hypothetical protein
MPRPIDTLPASELVPIIDSLSAREEKYREQFVAASREAAALRIELRKRADEIESLRTALAAYAGASC